ncbi:hypothetical protein [Bacillus pacificus]|uniref:hypothetical protein n=1 Tax=Bacillus pacificus TaxID=2026187 RepID=UPI003D65ECD8
MTQRQDSLDKYYNIVDKIKNVSSTLFWFNAVISLGVFFVNGNVALKNTLTIVFIVTTVAYFIVDNYLSISLIPNIEDKRRKHLLSNSFGIPLDNETTNKYYNNDINPSIIKLGINVMENALFAKNVTDKMAKKERIIIFLYLISWLLCLLLRNNNLEFISIVSQTLFASTILSSWLKLEVLRYQTQTIYDELYRLFLTTGIKNSNKQMPYILDAFVKYEAAKAYSGVKQSTKIFKKINHEVSLEWEQVKQQLKI